MKSNIHARPKLAIGTRVSIDGETRYFAGTNSYWIGFLTNNRDVDTVLDHISSSGLRILRIWGFNDVTRKLATGTINTGADGLQRLDYVVQSAENRGVKLIINFVNNWSDCSGMSAYVNAFGSSKESWYTNSRAQSQYKPTLLQLSTEPRCKGCSTDVIYKWATDISLYIRSLDRNHMITLGDEGFGLPGATSYLYQTSEGVDFVRNLAIRIRAWILALSTFIHKAVRDLDLL
ncbi:hypothetical protein N0V85_006072 [Neurospora sp. IMI 360204]|nr:hypothetical protein N0V85_006072 [Neurospora sp. IMI 360204]